MYTLYKHQMFRTQIYLPTKVKESLQKISKNSGNSQSELIRRALEKFIKDYRNDSERRESAFGLWKDSNIELEI